MGGKGSGGARVNSGPPPDPDSFRQNQPGMIAGWTTLPADARVETVPEWPLTEATPRELDLWAKLWTKPQGLMWERHGLADLVALYVRRFAEAEEPGAPVTLSTITKQLADSLGLTVPGARANYWRIEPAAAPAVAQEQSNPAADGTPAPAGRPASSRTRLRVVRDDEEA